MSEEECQYLKSVIKAKDEKIEQLQREIALLRAELSRRNPFAGPLPPLNSRDPLQDEDPDWYDVASALPPLPETEAPPPPGTDPRNGSPGQPQKRSRALSLPPNPISEVTKYKSAGSPQAVVRSAASEEAPALALSADSTASPTSKKKKSRRGSDASTESNSSATSPRHSSKKAPRDKSSKSPKSPSGTPVTGNSPPSSSSFLALSPRSTSTPPKPFTSISFADEKRSSAPSLTIHHASSGSSISSKDSKRSSDRRKRVAISTPQDVEKIKFLQTAMRSFLARKIVRDKLEKQRGLLRFSVLEILTTEKKYVESLDLLISHFKRPMENLPDIVSSQEVQMIFSNIEELRESNYTFLQALEQAFQSTDYVHISKVMANFFIAIAPDWRRYSVFCNNYWLSMNCLTACKERKAFSAWLKKAESIPEMGKLGLADWLIKAVKRVPQYVLLIKQVQKALPKGTRERQLVRTAKVLIKELAEWINERKKAVENYEKLNLIQASLYGRIPTLRIGGRVFVKETVILEKRLPKGRIYQKKLYLFNDSMLFAFLDGKFDKMIFLASPELSFVDPRQPSQSSSDGSKLGYSSATSSFGGVLGSASVSIPPPSSPGGEQGPDELILSIDGRSWALVFASRDEMNQWKMEVRHLIDDIRWMETNSPTKDFETANPAASSAISTKIIESKVEKEGWLMKSSGSKPFRKRWFILELGYLFYFKSKPSGGKEIQTSKDMRHIDLNVYFVRENEKYSTKKRFCFELHNTKQKSFLFAVDTKEERDSWIEAISPYTLFGKKKSSKDALAIDMVINPQQDLLQFSSSGSERSRVPSPMIQRFYPDNAFVDDDDANLTLDALTASRFYFQEDSSSQDGRSKMSGSTASLPGSQTSGSPRTTIPTLPTDKVDPALDDSEDGAISPTFSKEQIASAFGEPEKRKNRKKGSRDRSSLSSRAGQTSVVVLPTTAEAANELKKSGDGDSKRKMTKESSRSKITSPTNRRDSGGSNSSRVTTVLPPVVLRNDSKGSIPSLERDTMPTILPPPEAPKRVKRHSLKRSMSLNEVEDSV